MIARIAALLGAGMLVAASSAWAQTDPVTFSKDIAPILQRSCQACHRPDSIAPMSLLTYEEVRPYARAIKQRTALRHRRGAMPPWFIEREIGIQKFKDDISLSDAEIATIARWADAGAPRGNPADLPPARVFTDNASWQIGTPDLIVTSPAVDMKAISPDYWGALAGVPTGLTEDRYVAAIEIKEVNDSRNKPGRATVGGLFVFHHAVMSVNGPDGRPTGGGVAGARGRAKRGHLRFAGREAAAGRLDCLVAVGAPARQRERHARVPAVRVQVPSGRIQAADPVHAHHHRHRRHRHPGRREWNHAERVSDAVAATQAHGLRAPYALDGSSDVPRSDYRLARRDVELLWLRSQLGEDVRVPGRCGAAAASRHDPESDRLLRQHAGKQERRRSAKLVRAWAPVDRQHADHDCPGSEPHGRPVCPGSRQAPHDAQPR